MVVRAQQGSALELERLLKACYPKFLRAARSRLRDPDAAKDVVQETVIRVSENLSSLKNPRAFDSWSQQILNRRCFAHIDKEKRNRLNEQQIEDLLLIDSASTLEELDDKERAALIDAIQTLGEKSQEAVRLHYFFGLTVKEISSRVRVSVGAVKVRLHRARNELKARMVVHQGSC